jgi:hypothetical protein
MTWTSPLASWPVAVKTSLASPAVGRVKAIGVGASPTT